MVDLFGKYHKISYLNLHSIDTWFLRVESYIRKLFDNGSRSGPAFKKFYVIKKIIIIIIIKNLFNLFHSLEVRLLPDSIYAPHTLI